MNQAMNSDTPPTEQGAKSNLLSEEEDGRVFLAKINSYIDDLDLDFIIFHSHVQVPVPSHMRVQQNQILSVRNFASNFCMPWNTWITQSLK